MKYIFYAVLVCTAINAYGMDDAVNKVVSMGQTLKALLEQPLPHLTDKKDEEAIQAFEELSAQLLMNYREKKNILNACYSVATRLSFLIEQCSDASLTKAAAQQQLAEFIKLMDAYEERAERSCMICAENQLAFFMGKISSRTGIFSL